MTDITLILTEDIICTASDLSHFYSVQFCGTTLSRKDTIIFVSNCTLDLTVKLKCSLTNWQQQLIRPPLSSRTLPVFVCPRLKSSTVMRVYTVSL